MKVILMIVLMGVLAGVIGVNPQSIGRAVQDAKAKTGVDCFNFAVNFRIFENNMKD